MIKDVKGPPNAPSALTLLVVNADDLGLSRRINEGIIRAHQHGIVTAASLMPVGRGFAHAVTCCLDTPTLDLGIHLTAVSERPLLRPDSSLTMADGRFPASASEFGRRWLTGSIRPKDMEAEWTAQVECVLDQGIHPTHLDSHQHLHILPGLFDLSCRLAKRYRIPFIRVPVERPWRGHWSSGHGLKRILGTVALAATWALDRVIVAGRIPRTPPRFVGFHDGGNLDEPRLIDLLRGLSPGQTYELMCHPGLLPEEADIQSWGYGHEVELEALTSPGVRSMIDNSLIRLSTFSQLLES